MLCFISAENIPSFAAMLVIIGVSYLFGIYTGAYMFPVIKVEPPTPLSPEILKQIQQIHDRTSSLRPSLDHLLETHSHGAD